MNDVCECLRPVIMMIKHTLRGKSEDSLEALNHKFVEPIVCQTTCV